MCNNVARCCAEMLRAFDRTLSLKFDWNFLLSPASFLFRTNKFNHLHSGSVIQESCQIKVTPKRRTLTTVVPSNCSKYIERYLQLSALNTHNVGENVVDGFN